MLTALKPEGVDGKAKARTLTDADLTRIAERISGNRAFRVFLNGIPEIDREVVYKAIAPLVDFEPLPWEEIQ